MAKCDRHIWDTDDREWCWKCEELTIAEKKQTYENKLRDNGMQRTSGDKEITTILVRKQEHRG